MKFLFDIFPVILFFASYKWGERHVDAAQQIANQYLSGLISGNSLNAEQAPILLATALTIIASIAQISYLLLSKKKVDAMLWISFIIIAVFGSATIYFHSDTFIKWKPTVLYWCYAAAFLLGQYVFKKNLLKAAMGSQLTMPETVWAKLSLAWIAYFIFMGILNLYVAFYGGFDQSTWVSFKLYSIGAVPVFVILQSIFISKYIQEPT
ncbi:MAG: septation protein A [Undibacterium sp.]|jgi:intracellular septation protein|nr:septation protein A [Undibacterium sp.]MDO8701832.1 septation protein A [Undibacterium sp.]MDO9194389.1 septation protein A [Undibacterium sp.]